MILDYLDTHYAFDALDNKIIPIDYFRKCHFPNDPYTTYINALGYGYEQIKMDNFFSMMKKFHTKEIDVIITKFDRMLAYDIAYFMFAHQCKAELRQNIKNLNEHRKPDTNLVNEPRLKRIFREKNGSCTCF